MSKAGVYNSKHQMGDIKQVPQGGPTNISRHRSTCSHVGDLAPGICATLV
jgi:hypothetical protein